MPESPRSERARTPAGEAFDLGEFVATLERHRVLALIVAITVIVAGMLWSSTRAPVYRTTATLKLEQESNSTGMLSDLAALTSAPAAEGEMSILRSRALVEATVAESAEASFPASIFTPTTPDDFRMDGIIQMGLTTAVESEDRLPLNDLWRALGWKSERTHRLFARIETGREETSASIRVRFPTLGRVLLSIPSRKGLPDRNATEFDYQPGLAIEYSGSHLRLRAVGDYVGASYLVSHRPLKQAIDEFIGKMNVEETSRNSGVIRLTVSDSDPNRAAEFANALGHNYLLRSIRLGRSRATRTIDFVDQQLEEQKALLEEAEREVVELQRANPSVIMVSASAESLVERIAEQEADRARLGLAHVVLSEAIDLLDQGDHEALARLSKELPDLVTLSYLEAIGTLGSEAMALERSDVGATKGFLERKLEDLAVETHESSARLAALESAVTGLRAGDSNAVSRLCAQAPGIAELDPITAQYLTESARIDAEISTLQGDLTPTNPRRTHLRDARRDLELKVAERLDNLATGLRLAETDRAVLEDAFRESLASWPAEERERIELAVCELVDGVSRNLHARVESLESEEQGLVEQIAVLEGELSSLPERERTVAGPLRRREAHAQVVKLLLDCQQQAQLSAATTLPSAILIDPAIPHDERYSPRLFFYFVLSCAAGVGLGILSAFGRQALSGAIFSQAEVEDATGLPVFGSIPDFKHGYARVKRAPANFLPFRDDPEGPIAEAYRSIRENLRFALKSGTPLRTLGVTSCSPGEGKSTANISLAMSFAGTRQRVLLIDADMRKPSVHSSFGIELRPGLGEVIEKWVDWRACIRPSEYPGLEILCAGDSEASPGEILRSARVPDLIAEWKAEYDLVVFDLPPALAVADVEILAHELDAVILLYRSGGAHRDVLTAAARRLTRVGAHVLGAVVNAVRPTHSGSSSHYGRYGYGYGEGYGRKRHSQKTA